MPWLRAVAVWLVLIGAEVVHGTIRTALVAPRIGDARARRIGVFTGALLNLAIAGRFARWLGVAATRPLLGVGLLWVALAVAFEVAFGRLALRAPWERIAADYDPRRGGLLPLGLAALAGTPLLAARARGARQPAAEEGEDEDGLVES